MHWKFNAFAGITGSMGPLHARIQSHYHVRSDKIQPDQKIEDILIEHAGLFSQVHPQRQSSERAKGNSSWSSTRASQVEPKLYNYPLAILSTTPPARPSKAPDALFRRHPNPCGRLNRHTKLATSGVGLPAIHNVSIGARLQIHWVSRLAELPVARPVSDYVTHCG